MTETNEEIIYKMKLHDEVSISSTDEDDTWALRVPGGWVYRHWYYDGEGDSTESSVFVPFDNEFTNHMKEHNEN